MWPTRYRNGGAVQTTTGASDPEADASSFAKSAGVTESFPHGQPDEVPAPPPAQADAASGSDSRVRTASDEAFMLRMITAVARVRVRASEYFRFPAGVK